MIVGIDGASTDLSLALAHPDGTLADELAWTTSQRQSAELLPRLLELLARHGLTVRHVTGLAVGTGPGSFTGLRVAMALAKGLAVALERPIVGVPSLAAWLEAEPEATAALARAGARDAYVLTRGEPDPAIVDRDGLPDGLRAAIVVVPDELAAGFGLAGRRRPRGAGVMARRAASDLAANPDGEDVSRLEPIYLRAPRGVTAESEARVRWL